MITQNDKQTITMEKICKMKKNSTKISKQWQNDLKNNNNGQIAKLWTP